MSELVDRLRSEFQDSEYRQAYAEECLNTMIAAQIKVLREQRGMTQSALAEKAGMLQPRLSVMEDANYSSWSVSTLKRLARAFDLALAVKFESFSNVVLDFEQLSAESLARPSFEDDPRFRSPKVSTHRYFHKRVGSEEADRIAMQGAIGQTQRRADTVEFLDKTPSRLTGTNAANEIQNGYSPRQEGGMANAFSLGASS
jgi:transcriptional regulator with XRE-family HTH domain